MNKEQTAIVTQLGGNPADPIWRWFLLNGPHGNSFSWSQTKKEPPGYTSLEHLREIVAEKTENDISFPSRARAIAQRAITAEDLDMIRRGIQILAVVGTKEDIKLIEPLISHQASAISKDAKACLFVLKKA